jgi:hypothetical protein
MDHNPYLKLKKYGHKEENSGRGRIEHPEAIVNIPWQTRSKTPTGYEITLTKTLSQIFEADIDSLPKIVSELNSRKTLAPDGKPWTEEKFKMEIKRLAV